MEFNDKQIEQLKSALYNRLTEANLIKLHWLTDDRAYRAIGQAVKDYLTTQSPDFIAQQEKVKVQMAENEARWKENRVMKSDFVVKLDNGTGRRFVDLK